ncbi:unnamed protein product [Malus baccata var. baccata]
MASDKPAENFVQPAIPRFDGYYNHWSMLMENFLRSKEYWDLLQALRRDFETLQMKNEEPVTEYFAKTMGIVNKMRIHGGKLDDGSIVEKILRSMTPKFNYIVCSIEEPNDTAEISIDELQSSLLVHEQQLNRGITERVNLEEQALKASTFFESSSSRGRGRGRGTGRGRGGRGNRDGDRQHQSSKRHDDHSQNKGK